MSRIAPDLGTSTATRQELSPPQRKSTQSTTINGYLFTYQRPWFHVFHSPWPLICAWTPQAKIFTMVSVNHITHEYSHLLRCSNGVDSVVRWIRCTLLWSWVSFLSLFFSCHGFTNERTSERMRGEGWNRECGIAVKRRVAATFRPLLLTGSPESSVRVAHSYTGYETQPNREYMHHESLSPSFTPFGSLTTARYTGTPFAWPPLRPSPPHEPPWLLDHSGP